MIQEFVKAFVKERGYGPWYQHDAWQFFVDKPINEWPIIRMYDWLNNRYPQVIERE